MVSTEPIGKNEGSPIEPPGGARPTGATSRDRDAETGAAYDRRRRKKRARKAEKEKTGPPSGTKGKKVDIRA